MKAELISIGTEITTGRNLDTNCQWLSRRLAELGVPVGFHTTVADDLADNVAVFRAATARAALVLSTGGLGPTQDDLTREVLAAVAGVGLVEDPASLEQIRAMFASRGRTMPERNRVQAFFPEGAQVVPNPAGTAPGLWMRVGDAWVGCMPGVPSEMKRMFDEQIAPRLTALGLAGGVQIERKINTFGLGESAVEEQVGDLTRRGHVPEVGITASDAVIALRIIGRAENAQRAWEQIRPVEATIRERLGDLVFGVDGERLQDAVARLLAERRMSIATAESITAGRVAAALGEVPGISAWLRGGAVTYTDRIKTAILGVPAELIAEHTAVSAEVARAMAVGCRERFGSDVGVATVGYAGPTSDHGEPVGLAFAAVATPDGVTDRRFVWPGTRTEVQSRVTKMALNLVRLTLAART